MNEQLFHYTSIAAVKSIVESQTLRATNIATFEDKNELWGGLNPISACIQQVKEIKGLNGLTNFINSEILSTFAGKSMTNFYCISFCQEADYDFMWQNYANNECCFVFDKAKLLQAFLSDVSEPSQRRERTISMVKDDFMPCIYLYQKDIASQINIHLNTLTMTQIKDGESYNVPFEFSSPLVSCRKVTWDDIKNPPKAFDEPITIDIIENFTNLIKPALQLKFAGTDNEYEKEKEIRAVFRTPSNFVEQVNGDKKFIEIKLNSNLFFASLQGIKICPHAVNKNNLLNEINELNTLVISKNQSPIKIL